MQLTLPVNFAQSGTGGAREEPVALLRGGRAPAARCASSWSASRTRAPTAALTARALAGCRRPAGRWEETRGKKFSPYRKILPARAERRGCPDFGQPTRRCDHNHGSRRRRGTRCPGWARLWAGPVCGLGRSVGWGRSVNTGSSGLHDFPHHDPISLDANDPHGAAHFDKASVGDHVHQMVADHNLAGGA